MNIVFLTLDEPLYLPGVFTTLLNERGGDTRAVFMVRPRYGVDSTWQMVRKYTRAFGVGNLCRLVQRTAAAKLRDRLGFGRSNGKFHSIPAACASHGIACEVIENVNDERFHQRLREMGTDLLVSVSCPQIFKPALIDLPPRGCLNMHGALLPKYRGLLPSFWMMLNGETEAGVTIFLVNRDIDLGDVVEVESFPIRPDETLEQFIIRSKTISADVLLRAIRKVEGGACETTPLSKEGGSYYSFPTRADYRAFRRRGRRLW